MGVFRYTGVNRYGERLRGQVEAETTLDAEQQLKVLKIDVLSLKSKGSGSRLFSKQKVTRKEVIAITFQLEQLLRAGVPLMEILADLRDSFENKSVKEMLSSIHELMEGGETLSVALNSYRHVFGDVFVALIAVGEKTGQMDVILADLCAMLKWEDELKAKAKKIMIYPAIVGTVVLAVVMLMMVFVVPQLLGFIDEMGGDVNFSTQALIITSNFIQKNILWIFITPLAMLVALKIWLNNSKRFRIHFDAFIFKITIIGPVLYKLKIARLANALAVMYASGVSFTDSLLMAARIANNAYIEQNLFLVVRLIQEGESIHQAFSRVKVLPPLGVRMVKVGEQSGKMDEALKNVSYFYDREAKEAIEKIEPAIEPLLTVIMAVIVGWVMIAVLGPVYDTMTKVQF